MIADLLALADALVSNESKPSEAVLRRAVSTAYYALFHALAQNAADLIVGSTARNEDAWVRVYRALDHGSAVKACHQIGDNDFGDDITGCAARFAQLQNARHAADYDPAFTLAAETAKLQVEAARIAIEALHRSSSSERRRFAVYLLFKKR